MHRDLLLLGGQPRESRSFNENGTSSVQGAPFLACRAASRALNLTESCMTDVDDSPGPPVSQAEQAAEHQVVGLGRGFRASQRSRYPSLGPFWALRTRAARGSLCCPSPSSRPLRLRGRAFFPASSPPGLLAVGCCTVTQFCIIYWSDLMGQLAAPTATSSSVDFQ